MFDIILNDDPMALACLCAILLIIGSNMAYQPAIRWWGKRIACVGYVLFCLFAYFGVGPTSAGELAHIAFRALFASGLTLAAAWAGLAMGIPCLHSIRSMLASRRRPTPAPAPQIVYVEKPAPPPPAPAPTPTADELFAAALAIHTQNVGLLDRVPVDPDTLAALHDEENGELVNDVRAIIKGAR